LLIKNYRRSNGGQLTIKTKMLMASQALSKVSRMEKSYAEAKPTLQVLL
jgi:hypothetical protein